MIYQDIQITVNQGLAQPDKSLYIFRGDSNIVLNFKLVNPEYKLTKDSKDNLVTRFGVDNFELRLQLEKGYDRIIRGVITEDGCCRTQLTQNVIQELRTGTYSYQITLIDDDNNAIMTFPICKAKLNILDRMSLTAEELAVPGGLSGEAMTDLSVIADNGDKIEAFDSNGNYIKTNWSPGDVISSAKLNKIEEGIDEVNKKATQLDDKKFDKNGILSMANMGQDIKEAMTGGSVAVIGKNTVLSENIVDNQVRERNTSFLSLNSKNLYDKDYAVYGILENDGNIIPSSFYLYTDYIEVNEGDLITITQSLTSPGCCYDANKNILNINPYTATAINSPYTFTVPAGVKYIRLNFHETFLNSFVVCHGASIISNTYASYELSDKVTVNKKQIKNLNVSIDEVEFIKSSENLFNKSNITKGVLLSDGTVTSNTAYFISDFINVEEFDKITLSKTYTSPGCYYDKNKKVIPNLLKSDNIYSPYTYNVPDGVKYIRVNLDYDIKDSYMLVGGDKLPSNYVPYEKYLDSSIKVTNNKWYGKKCVTFGDSITWYDKQTYGDKTNESGVKVKGYQSYLEELGLIVNNQGVSGDTTPQICARVKNFDFTNYDLVTFMSGTNDFRDRYTESIGQLKPIGTSFDVNTFIGAYQSMIESVLNRYPGIRILIFTPFRVWHKGEEISKEYIEAVKSVGGLYGIPVLDLYNNSGFNKLTKGIFIVDNTSKVSYEFHPSTKGYKRLADCIIPFLENS